MPAIQDNRNVEIHSALGSNALLFLRMTGSDGLSMLSEYRLDLLSEQADLRIDSLLGQDMSLLLDLPGGGAREFNGIVTRFVLSGRQGRYASYQATLRPWLWFLTRAADCCIFQEKSAVDIIKAIFDKYTMADYDLGNLSASYPVLEY
jgi:type VI secretion system secreted protein VgrG